MKRFFPLAVALLSFISCQQNKEGGSGLHLTETGQVLQLPLDDETANISDGLQYVDGSTPLLFNLNWAKNSLQIYDLEAKSKLKEIFFEAEGPDGVDVMSMYVHNLDSIFLFNQMTNQIAVTDTSGRVYSRIKYEGPKGYSPAFVHNTFFHSDPVLRGDEMTVKTRFHGNIRELTSEELATKEILFGINLKTGSTRFYGIKYPSNYLDKGLKSFEPSIAASPDRFVLSFFGDHQVYQTQNLDQPLQPVALVSDHIQGEIPVFRFDGEGAHYGTYVNSIPHYESIVYDPYRNTFLRFAMHGFEAGDDVPKSDLRNYSGPFSIQVLDKDLNLISEKAFEKNTYHPFNFFIAKEGLYMSLNHPLNPENEEDFLSFKLIKYE